jgi:hypothetical protein
MPLYEFVNDELGVKLDIPFPVDLRPDQIVLKRKSVPSRITVGVGAKPLTTGEKVLTGFRKMEANGKLPDRPGYLSATQIKKAWAVPDAPEPVPAK